MSMVFLPGFIPDIRDSPVQFKISQVLSTCKLPYDHYNLYTNKTIFI